MRSGARLGLLMSRGVLAAFEIALGRQRAGGGSPTSPI